MKLISLKLKEQSTILQRMLKKVKQRLKEKLKSLRQFFLSEFYTSVGGECCTLNSTLGCHCFIKRHSLENISTQFEVLNLFEKYLRFVLVMGILCSNFLDFRFKFFVLGIKALTLVSFRNLQPRPRLAHICSAILILFL